jgi:hypothetical protein
MVPQLTYGAGCMSAMPAWMRRVAAVTAVALLFASFACPPVRSPGISISKAVPADAETAAAEHTCRDAEEDTSGEHELTDLVAVDRTAFVPLPSPSATRWGQLSPHARWSAAGRQHGPNSVRGPPA